MLRVGLGTTNPNALKFKANCCPGPCCKGNECDPEKQQKEQSLLAEKIGLPPSEKDVMARTEGEEEQQLTKELLTSHNPINFKGKTLHHVALKEGVSGKGCCSTSDAKNQSINYVI